ncbi:MAG TPA: IS110 family transposase [Candidatus Acidoferrales bacterium]|nr:IS110 family transposase [Candidatus Acidoferrales bacterium]
MAKAKTTKRRHRKLDRSLPVMRPNAGGIDIGATEILVAVPADRDTESVRSFPSFTQDLYALADWLQQCRVDTVAMESTSVYWIPLFQILEARGIQVHLVNAQHVHHVPGRKSDVLDCQWLQYLHSVGLLRASFRPEQAVCEIRSLMRHRENLVQMACVHVQHMHKSLDQMNLQIHHVISDITGVTGLAIVDAIVLGETDPHKLADLRDYRIRASIDTVCKSLVGDYRPEHIFTLKQSLTAYRHYQTLIADCDEQIQQRIRTFQTKDPGPTATADPSGATPSTTSSFDLHSHLQRIFGVDLTLIPGFDVLGIQRIFSEIGSDLSKFPTDDAFCSWQNLCPKDGFSAGRRIRGPKLKTKNRVTQVFRLAAQALHHSKSYLGDYYRSQRARHGAPKAIKNTAHKLSRIFCHCVRTREPYDETVFIKLEARNQQRRLRKLRSFARQMGYTILPQTV